MWVPREQSWICWSKVKLDKYARSGFCLLFPTHTSTDLNVSQTTYFLNKNYPPPSKPTKQNKQKITKKITALNILHCRIHCGSWIKNLNWNFLKLCLGGLHSSENQASEAKASGANKWKGKTWMLRRGLHLDGAMFFIIERSLSLHFMVVYCDLHHATDILWDSPLRAFWVSGNLLMTLKKYFRSSVAESLEAISSYSFYVQDWKPQ